MSAHVGRWLGDERGLKDGSREPSGPFRAEAIGPSARRPRDHVVWSRGKFTRKTRAGSSLDLKTSVLLEDQDVPGSARKQPWDRYHGTIKYIMRDKTHSKTPVHSIVAEMANAMTNPGHSGRPGASPATGPVSSAWLRSRTVMSMAISCHRPNEISDRLETVALRFKVENCSSSRIANGTLTQVLSERNCNLIVQSLIRMMVDANSARCCRCASLPYQVGACLKDSPVMLTICPLWPA
jgi:hypothetical protein